MKRIKRSGGGILNRALTLIALVAVLVAGVVIGQHLPKQSKDQVTVATVSAKLARQAGITKKANQNAKKVVKQLLKGQLDGKKLVIQTASSK